MATVAPPVTELATGLRFSEGPIAMPDGSVILVEIARQTLSRVTPGGTIYVTNNGGFEWIERPGKLFPALQAT